MILTRNICEIHAELASFFKKSHLGVLLALLDSLIMLSTKLNIPLYDKEKCKGASRFI